MDGTRNACHKTLQENPVASRQKSSRDTKDIIGRADKKGKYIIGKSQRTAAGIPTWSPTVVLISRSTAYVWQSGRDAQYSAACGRTWKLRSELS